MNAKWTSVCSVVVVLAGFGCTIDGADGFEGGLLSAGAPKPGPVIRGPVDPTADPTSYSSSGWFGAGARYVSDGTAETNVCFPIEQAEGSSCGEVANVQLRDPKISGSISIPLPGGFGASVSYEDTEVTRPYRWGSGPCETCWPVICYPVTLRFWRAFQLGSGLRLPQHDYTDTEFGDPRRAPPECRDDSELCGCADAGSGEDAGPGEDADRGGESDVDRHNSSPIDDDRAESSADGSPASDSDTGYEAFAGTNIDDVFSIDLAEHPTAAGWDQLNEVDRCNYMASFRDAAAQRGRAFDRMMVRNQDNSLTILDGLELVACD